MIIMPKHQGCNAYRLQPEEIMPIKNNFTELLKRKRGQLEAMKPSKRPRRNHDISQFAPKLAFSKIESDAAPGTINKQETSTNGFNKDRVPNEQDLNSPEAEDFHKSADKIRTAKHKRKTPKNMTIMNLKSWKTSEPIGGHMLEIEPVFTADEQFLIVAHRRAIQIYSTSNSLLHRSISLPTDRHRNNLARIIGYELSPNDPNILWVACSNGLLYRINWISGQGSEKSWKTSSEGTARMTLVSMTFSGKKQDVLFTIEKCGKGWRLCAHELTFGGGSATFLSRIVYESDQKIQLLKVVDDGDTIIAASKERVLLGSLRSINIGTVDKISYEFRTFESTDFVTCLDARVSKRNAGTKLDKVKVVDVVLGGAKGAIFVYNDLLRNLNESRKPSTNKQHPIYMIPRKLHWHRKAVKCVKWSLDGQYIISGGSETVLVLWQLDTGRQQYLPHLSATIQNVVVSPTGTSYALNLGDNSAMIMSTSELVSTAYIAGIQAKVIGSPNIDSHVKRIGDKESGPLLVPRIPAVINPIRPENLLLAVGETQEAKAHSAEILSAPFLQTFNVASNHNVSRQAISRTNITNKNVAPSAYTILEPAITYIQISYDGTWLATVDEWIPPTHDLEVLDHGGMSLEEKQHRRREVYLKFWQRNKLDDAWDLISRIDAPHAMAFEAHGAGRILSLTADPKSHAFSTLGEDGIVQIWHTRIRKRDGVIVRGGDGEPLRNWHCQRRTSLGTIVLDDDVTGRRDITPAHGALAYSEDGSILAAAINGYDDGLVHLIDPASGIIQSSRSLLYRGDIVSLALSAQHLITLSDELRVYDLVLDELKYGITLRLAQNLLLLEQKSEMIHLAVDCKSHTFAVALPCYKDKKLDKNNSSSPLSKLCSEITVFDPRQPTPLHVQCLSSPITALLPASSSPGYLILDTAAEIRTISPNASQTLTSMARSMVDLRLDMTNESPDLPSVDLVQALEAEVDIEMEEEPPNGTIIDLEDQPDDDTEDGPPVVTVHQLSQVLDIGPSFALPPIEELFYAVADLLSSKPESESSKLSQ